ncbi:MAG: DNA-binding domain-containing protein [Pseudomonadota bacterium]
MPVDVSTGLAASQAAFVTALVNPTQPAPTDIRRPSGSEQTRRFDIYRNNVTVAAIDALADTFPAVHALVGEAFFRATARAYFDEEPPRTPLLFRYGATFGDFLDGFPPAANVPYAGDVARLEYARLQAYHAADAEPVGIAVLSTVSPDAMGAVRLARHPAVHLLSSRFPVVSLWGASMGLTSHESVDMRVGETALTIRPALDVETRILPPGAYPFFEAILEGATLEGAAEAAAIADPSFDLSTHLSGLFDTGAITGIIPSD